MLLVMACLPIGKPYYTVASDRDVDPSDFTAEIEARINYDAPCLTLIQDRLEPTEQITTTHSVPNSLHSRGVKRPLLIFSLISSNNLFACTSRSEVERRSETERNGRRLLSSIFLLVSRWIARRHPSHGINLVVTVVTLRWC
jgi:hypothetical protein